MESIITAICTPQTARTSAPRPATRSPERFEGLTLIRMAAAFYVVFHHMTTDSLENAPKLVSLANDIGWSVPFFLLLAGFLMARSIDGGVPAQVSTRCIKSARRVLWLWLGWSLIYLINPPLKPLIHFDINGLIRHYTEFLATAWPRMLWVGSSFHLWFSASLLMAWLLVALVAKMNSGFAMLLVRNSKAALKYGVSLALLAGVAIWHMPQYPVSTLEVGLEVLVAHILLPFSFVLMGASLWQYRSLLSNWKTLIFLVCLAFVLRAIETEWLELDLKGGGPRRMYASNLLFGSAALAIGLLLPLTKPLSGIWLVTPGIYCVHMLIYNRVEAVYGTIHTWTELLGSVLAVFIVSAACAFALSRLKKTSFLAT